MNRNQIQEWLVSSGPSIVEVLTARREQLVRDRPNDSAYNNLTHTLSEMPLCGAVASIPLPAGFYPQYGLVHFSHKPSRKYNHAFAVKDNQNLIDITVGQFFTRSKNKTPGKAMMKLAQRAPEYFFTYGELVVLYGSYKDIQTKLGIFYHWD